MSTGSISSSSLSAGASLSGSLISTLDMSGRYGDDWVTWSGDWVLGGRGSTLNTSSLP